MSRRDSTARLASYVSYLDGLTGVASTLREVAPREPEAGRVLTVAYVNTPGPGYVTGFTYGLSFATHPDWEFGGRELCITVRSEDLTWTDVPTLSVAALRGLGPFNSGQVMGYQEPYVPPSRMNNIVLGDPVESWRDGLTKLADVGSLPGDLDQLEILEAYPIYASEREFIRAHGADAFWSLPWDRFDPMRPPVA